MSFGLIKKHEKKNNNDFFNFLTPFEAFPSDKLWLMQDSDMTEDDDKYMLKLQIPGVKKDEIKLAFKNDTLTVSWEHKTKHEQSVGNESFYVNGADVDKIDANLKDGILNITIPKCENAKAQMIEIN